MKELTINEIKDRIKSKDINVIKLLIKKGLLNQLNTDELIAILSDSGPWLIPDLLEIINILGISAEAIPLLSKMKELDLGGQNLEFIPNSIGDLKSLEYLILDHNYLKMLPESIGALLSLKELNLLNNQLVSLPKSIGKLESLQELDLCDNKLKKIPDSIGKLTSLQTLRLSENELKRLPESILRLKNLQVLDLSLNPLDKKNSKNNPILSKLEKKCIEIRFSSYFRSHKNHNNFIGRK